jgi:protein-S-isoprenylcysteine O-methyltransferase Ste14
MNDTLFRILAATIFAVTAGISIYHRRKADREAGKVSLQEEGLLMILILRVLGLFGWGSIIAWMLNPAWMDWSRIDLPEWLRWLGVGLGVTGAGLAWWVFSNLKNNVTPTVITRAGAQLVTSGPYRWVRHPLYVMGLIGAAGYALLAENWFILLIMAIAFAALAVRTGHEEARLVEKFGDAYRQYMQRTGRFFPKFF